MLFKLHHHLEGCVRAEKICDDSRKYHPMGDPSAIGECGQAVILHRPVCYACRSVCHVNELLVKALPGFGTIFSC